MGWTSWQVLAMFAAGIVGTAALIVWEKKTPSPLIPLTMFENKQYTLLLAISFCTFFYLTALNTYVPLGVQDLIGASTTVSGLIQMPKTIVTVILPMFCGAWIVKRQKNLWIALAIACLFIAVPFAFLVFIGPNMPVWFVIAMVVLTGIADSFRSVSIAPAAQSMLAPKDLGVGTSLIGFMNSLSGSLSAAICGIAYDTLTQKTPGIKGMTEGIDTAFLITAGVAVIGLILVLFVFRPMIAKSSRKKN
jgi:hypothetical protein